jgi:hypothetical protein
VDTALFQKSDGLLKPFGLQPIQLATAPTSYGS